MIIAATLAKIRNFLLKAANKPTIRKKIINPILKRFIKSKKGSNISIILLSHNFTKLESLKTQ